MRKNYTYFDKCESILNSLFNRLPNDSLYFLEVKIFLLLFEPIAQPIMTVTVSISK